MSARKSKSRVAPNGSRKGPWSHAEVERVKRMYGTYPEAVIASKLKRPLATMRKLLMKIYDEAERRTGPWSAVEIQELRSLLGRAEIPVIARKLRRDLKDLEHRIALLRGQIKPRPWTSDDEQMLKQFYGSRSDGDLSLILGRPQAQIEEKAQQLCLAKDKTYLHRVQGVDHVTMPRWTDETIALLKSLYPSVRNVDIARQLNRSTKSIVSKAHDLGLKKSFERLREMGRQNVSQRHHRLQKAAKRAGAAESSAEAGG